MRNKFRSAIVTVSGLQGVAGVGCVASGAFLLWGVGVALVLVGAFLLVGAWGSR